MKSHYEILKAMKTGFSTDFRTAIYARSISGSGEEYEKTLSGQPPLILSDSVGKPLVSWSITGNTYNDNPTPEQPIEVKGVGKKIANLFDKNSPSNIVGYGLNTSGIAVSSYRRTTSHYIYVGNVDYIYVSNKTTQNNCFYAEMNENSFIETIIQVTGILKIPSGAKYYRFSADHEEIDRIIVNEGNKPIISNYNCKIPVVSRGKNLCNYKEIPQWEIWSSSTGAVRKFYNLKPNTYYTLSSNVPNGDVWNKGALIYFNGGSTESNGVFSGKTKTLRTDDTGLLFVGIVPARKYYDDILSGTYYIQLEEGSTATAYEPIATTNLYLDSPLMADEVLDSTGKREVKWGKLVLTGDESWIYSNTSGIFYITGLQIDYKKTSYPAVNYYSTHFKSSASSTGGAGMKDGEIRFYNGTSSTKEIYIKYTAVGNVDAFKVWLRQQNANGTPVIVYYQLANPLTESFDIPEIPTSKGNCVLDTDTEVQLVNMEITYKSGGKV